MCIHALGVPRLVLDQHCTYSGQIFNCVYEILGACIANWLILVAECQQVLSCLQTIFYTLPLACGAPREDLISPDWFVREAKDMVKLQYNVHCKHSELLEASFTFSASVSNAACGSDTKSIACQVSDDALYCRYNILVCNISLSWFQYCFISLLSYERTYM